MKGDSLTPAHIHTTTKDDCLHKQTYEIIVNSYVASSIGKYSNRFVDSYNQFWGNCIHVPSYSLNLVNETGEFSIS